MKYFLYALLLMMTASPFFSACNASTETGIIGSWRIDSIYDNYNGFSFTNRDPSPREVYEYRPDNTVLRKGMGEEKLYFYKVKDTILTLSVNNTSPGDDFTILHIDRQQLAIKKNKKPLFPGKNQTRYEVRYFSRIDSASSKH
ncbi:hypothetical protein [Flavihumibacter fluvii]|uniref:hypothetical protein n=1 Tax=Flavihumibacter fluvii TaxID=2838157 RepID=UPI001BDE84E7|nr:hypothetical protein [Flavihumibacter fluvii]ULQ53277.1 hypothetical protein KJS93_02970 [Flavihumibacter fluvii]